MSSIVPGQPIVGIDEVDLPVDRELLALVRRCDERHEEQPLR